MNRRQFLSIIWAGCLAAAVLAISGCRRAVTGVAPKSPPPNQAVPTPETSEPTPAVPSPQPTAKKSFPDVVVVKGSSPARNLARALGELGGIERFVKRGDRVVIKPNLTHPVRPQYAVCTNPQLVGALVALCRTAGAAEVVVFDRGGDSQKKAFRLSGIGAAVRRAGGEVKELLDEDFQMRRIPRGRLLTEWPLAKEAFEADVFINVPIAKHHNLAGLTMAMKNLMGLMGGDRSVMHEEFAQRIVDLNTVIRPDLTILDAHRVLVRNGPISLDLSDVRTLNTLVAGANPVSVDAFGTTLFGKRPDELEYLVKAHRRGLGEIDLSRLEIAKV